MENNKLVLIGGGGHCRSVLDTAIRTGKFSEIVITDPAIPAVMEIFGYRIAGNDEVLPALKEQGFKYAFITVGDMPDIVLRKKLAQKAVLLGFRFPVIADPSAIISEYAEVGDGTFVGKRAVINAGAVIGQHCIINTGSIIEHECSAGDFSHVSVGSVLCGEAHVGSGSFIGAGSTVRQGITIGEHALIGAGSVVVKDIPSGVKAYGNPCRVIV